MGAHCLSPFHAGSSGSSHPRCQELLQAGGPVQQFVDGSEPCDSLKCWMGLSRSVNANEQWLEGLHAITQRGISWGRRMGPVHVALIHHLPSIKLGLTAGGDEEGEYNALAMYCNKVRPLGAYVSQLALGMHPVLRPILSQVHWETSVLSDYPHRATAVRVIYHRDGPSLFGDLSQLPGPD